MDDIKIPMKIFQTYEELTEYYKDGVDMELGLYVSEGKLLVGHAPTAYSFNPQYFTGNNELMPDYVPESPIDYTITATPNNTTYGYVTGGGTYPQHSEITLNAYAYNGYKFDKWSNGVETSAYTFAVEENANLVGNFADNTYTVTLTNSPYGTLTGAGTYIANSSVTVTATPNEGHYFIAWVNLATQSIASLASEYTFTLVEDTELRADFGTYRTVTATPNNVDYGSTTGSGNQYKYNDSVTVTATAESGYRFVNWTEDNVEVSTSSSYTFKMNINDVTLVANFEPATANISISANPAGYGSVDAAGSTIIGESYTVMAEANTGYMFVNWTENGTEVSTSANYTFTVTGDRTLVANFENPLEEPFYVENITNADETLSITKTHNNAPTITIEYSTDKQTWNSLGTTSTSALTRTIEPGAKLYLRCNATAWGDTNCGNTITGVSKVGGNIMSLLYGSNFTGNETTFPTDSHHTFERIFMNNTSLQSADKLLLPATTMANNCYEGMFWFATALTSTPKIPQCTGANYCFSSMFRETSITSFELPIFTKESGQQAHCQYMFYNCSLLNYIKCLMTSTNFSYSNWLQNVSATGTFVKAAGVKWPTGNSGIPSGWTVVEV